MHRLNFGFEIKFAKDAPDGAFAGYGSVFGNRDLYGDVIAKGAFKETLREAKKNSQYPSMLLEHGSVMYFGATPEDDLPIGVWTELKEDDVGLYVEGQLALKTRRGAEVYELMRMDPRPAIAGLSIGYRAVEWAIGTKPDEPRRTIKKLELFEVSLTGMPANRKAGVRDVKSMTIRDFEGLLRDAGFSNTAAKAIASRGFKASDADRDDGGSESETVGALRSLVSTIRK